MDILVVEPDSSRLITEFGKQWVNDRRSQHPLAKFQRIQQIGLLSSFVDNGRRGEQFVLTALEGEEVKGLLGSENREWDASFFNIPVTHVTPLIGAQAPDERAPVAAELLARFEAALSPEPRYMITRVDAADVALISALQSAGFHYLVSMISLGRSHSPRGNPPTYRGQHMGIESSPWSSSDLDDLMDISRSAFSHSRFHVEPGLPKDTADEIHACWIRNCCTEGIADEVLVARSDGRVAGFIALSIKETEGQSLGTIVLVATHYRFRRLGIGTCLMNSAINWFADRVDYMGVTTELTNLEAIAMYGRFDFEIELADLYLSRWVQ